VTTLSCVLGVTGVARSARFDGVGGSSWFPTHITCTTAPQPLKASLSTAFKRVCEMVSKRSSGSCFCEGRVVKRVQQKSPQTFRSSDARPVTLTRSGSHRPSATPYSLSVAVPATAKSFGVVIHPILSQTPRCTSSNQPGGERRRAGAAGSNSRIHRRDERFRMWVEGRGGC
jgi:hypothetical protein